MEPSTKYITLQESIKCLPSIFYTMSIITLLLNDPV